MHALDWLLDSLIEDHDEIVVLRVIEPGSSAYLGWKSQVEESREEAERVLEGVMRRNGEDRQVSGFRLYSAIRITSEHESRANFDCERSLQV